MKNFELSLPLVNGELQDIFCGDVSGKEVVHELITDDFGPPPKSMDITVTTESGKKVKLVVPYDDDSNVVVLIDGEKLV